MSEEQIINTIALLNEPNTYGPKGRGFESSNARNKDWRASSPFNLYLKFAPGKT